MTHCPLSATYKKERITMKLNTKHFGELEVQEENIITFEKGIPGFNELKQYIIINDDEESSPFCWLQSIEESQLAFVLVNPYLVYADYKPNLPEIEIAKLGEATPEDYSVLSIVRVPEEVEKMTANLRAPIVINLKTKKAMQIITDGEDALVRYQIFEQLKNKDK